MTIAPLFKLFFHYTEYPRVFGGAVPPIFRTELSVDLTKPGVAVAYRAPDPGRTSDLPTAAARLLRTTLPPERSVDAH